MANPTTNEDTPAGFGFAVSAYLLWGFLPLYMKALAHISPAEVVAHRVIWSVPLVFALLVVMRRTGELRAALANPRTLAMAALTAALVTCNWGIYVWAIATDRALDAALGYYINPLFSMLLGAVFLGERLTKAQMFAVGLAAAAVVVLTLSAGSIPWVALGLTFSWGFYAFFKKSLPIGPNQGFLLEVLILLVPALGYVIYLSVTGASHFLTAPSNTWLLLGCGIVTAVPLILYANGAKLLRLSTVGILQYIVPTMVFLVAVFWFDEPFTQSRMIAFPMIWAAVVIYTVSLVQGRRKRNKNQKAV